MRVALTIYDENGALEVASVDCDSFVGGCSELERHMGAALWRFQGVQVPGSTATRAELGLTGVILDTLDQLGDLEDLPVAHSC